MNTSEIEKRFEEYRDHLRREIGRLADYVALYRRLHERRTDRLFEINFAPAFFSLVTEAVLSAIILWTGKLFDEKGQRGIFDFLKFIEDNRDMFSIERLKCRRKFPDDHWVLDRRRKEGEITLENITKNRERLKTLGCLKSFKIRRDKFYAHFDKDYFFDHQGLSNNAPITWKDLEAVVEALSEVINEYSAAYDAHSFELTSSNINDLDHILDALHEYQENMTGGDAG